MPCSSFFCARSPNRPQSVAGGMRMVFTAFRYCPATSYVKWLTPSEPTVCRNIQPVRILVLTSVPAFQWSDSHRQCYHRFLQPRVPYPQRFLTDCRRAWDLGSIRMVPIPVVHGVLQFGNNVAANGLPCLVWQAPLPLSLSNRVLGIGQAAFWMCRINNGAVGK